MLKVLHAGDESFANLVAYRWKWNDRLKLVVVNFANGYSRGRIPLAINEGADSDYLFLDELNDRSYVRNAGDIAGPGLHVVLEGFHVHVFDVKPLS